MIDLTAPAVPAMSYARITSDTLGGAGCAEQEEACRRLMTELGFSDRGGRSDHGVSGRTPTTRPGLAELLRRARAGDLSVIVTNSLDRLSRKMVDVHDFIAETDRLGARVLTVEEGWIDASTLTSFGLRQAAAVQRVSKQIHDRQREVRD